MSNPEPILRDGNELLGLDHVALVADGPTLSLGILPGQWIGVYGPAASGKSWLLRVLAGAERPARGAITRNAEPCAPDNASLLGRARPLALARRGQGAQFTSLATEALIATRLWNERNTVVSKLSPAQAAAAKLLNPLTSGSSLLLLDGHLDQLDPWARRGVLDFLRRKRERGVSIVAASSNVSMASDFDALVVMNSCQVRFAGTPEELLRSTSTHEFAVSADNQPGVRALVAPFSVSVEQRPDSLVLKAAEGQELAARLLLEGYGNVRFVVHRPPSVGEALMGLIK